MLFECLVLPHARLWAAQAEFAALVGNADKRGPVFEVARREGLVACMPVMALLVSIAQAPAR